MLHPLAIDFPNISPVALSLGPLEIRWYGLAYATGLILGWLYVGRLIATPGLWPPGRKPFAAHLATDLLLCATIGVVVGGRLGDVLLYEPYYYWQHPAEILQIWRGGMAFHGGLIGTAWPCLCSPACARCRPSR
jgi:phosphatidylglycerol---prolipoprotein diacylglyceryl transferase